MSADKSDESFVVVEPPPPAAAQPPPATAPPLTPGVEVPPKRTSRVEQAREGVTVGVQRASLLGKVASERLKEKAKDDRKVRLAAVILGASIVHIIKASRFVSDETPTRLELGQLVVLDHIVVDYIMCVGPISLGFCIGYLAFLTSVPAMLEKTFLTFTYNQLFATFICIWWVCGAAVGTIEGPFEGYVGLGYFASWTACVASLKLFDNVFLSRPFLGMATWGSNAGKPWESKLYLLILFFSSGLVFITCMRIVFWNKKSVTEVSSGEFPGTQTVTVTNQPNAHGPAIYGVVVSAWTLKEALVLNLMSAGDWSRGVTAIILLALWIAAVAILTVSDPFENAGNGYFGVWLCTFCCAGFLVQEFQTKIPSSRRFAPAALLCGSSLVILVESIQYVKPEDFLWRGDLAAVGLGAYALASGVISFVVGLFLLLAVLAHEYSKYTIQYTQKRSCQCKPLLKFLFTDEKKVFGHSFHAVQAIAALMVVYWVVAACVLTYGFPPYKDLTNGYIASWVCVLASAMLLQNEPPAVPPPGAHPAGGHLSPPLEEGGTSAIVTEDEAQVDSATQDVPLPPDEKPPPKRLNAAFFTITLSLSSFLLLMAAIERIVDENSAGEAIAGVGDATAEKDFAVAVPVITTFYLFVRGALVHPVVVAKLEPTMGGEVAYMRKVKWITIFLVPLTWIFAVIVLTFEAPFDDPGNGFFSTWFGLLSAFGLAFEEYQS